MGRRREHSLGTTWGSAARRNCWPAKLLAASILSSCFLLTQAQDIPVTREPLQPLKGQDVTLTPGGKPNFVICSWFRGIQAEANRIITYVPSLSEQWNGPVFTGRETGGPGCSLHIRSLTLSDTGDYLASKTVSGGSENGRVHIEVSEKLPPPILRPTDFFVTGTENATVVYPLPELHSTVHVGAILVVGSLAIAALAGTLLYCFFRVRKKGKNSRQVNPTSPVYENTRPFAQAMPKNSSEVNNTYEELQHGSQSVYDQLRWEQKRPSDLSGC